jgi:ABC-type antimicrobial peptide transport system permease subunit
VIGRGLRYGVLATRRRMATLLLPVVTTATGAFLVVLVLSLAPAVRRQAATFGSAHEIYRATLLITILVLLVGVVEVAVCTTRAISQRTREIGVLGAVGVRRAPVVAALLVEPMAAAVAGAVAGSVVAVIADTVLGAAGAAAQPDAGSTAAGVGLAIGVSLIAAAVTSIVPSYHAASRPPIRSLNHGG